MTPGRLQEIKEIVHLGDLLGNDVKIQRELIEELDRLLAVPIKWNEACYQQGYAAAEKGYKEKFTVALDMIHTALQRLQRWHMIACVVALMTGTLIGWLLFGRAA